nr:hypothetical protein [Tanacetum cinerariifolium]
MYSELLWIRHGKYRLKEYWKQEPRSLVMYLTQRVIKHATRSFVGPFTGEKFVAWYPPDIRKEDHKFVALEEKRTYVKPGDVKASWMRKRSGRRIDEAVCERMKKER